MRKAVLLVLGCLLIFSCNREKEDIIPGNEAPPDATVNDIVLESYINRSYIILVGEKPNSTDLAASMQTLRANSVSQTDRENFIEGVQQLPAYHQRLFDVGRGLYLNGADTTAINEEIFLFNLLLLDSQYVSIFPILEAEIDRMEAVLAIPDDLASGAINVIGMHKRLAYNRLYDQINMGTQNFVISVFQNFLNRYPTDSEREAAELMVDGFSSVVFLETGRNKSEFVDIFFQSRDYFEGQVRQMFLQNLFREPMSQELESLTISFRGNEDYEALQRVVLSMDEFVGI